MEGWTDEEIRNKNLRAPCGIFCSNDKKGQLPVCGMCLYACPYGKKTF